MSLTSEITQKQSLLYPGIYNDVLKTFSPRLLPAGLTLFMKKSNLRLWPLIMFVKLFSCTYKIISHEQKNDSIATRRN